MTSEAEKEVYRASRSAQDRYAYFLLAAAGAGIALAVNQTEGAVLAWAQLPLAVGVLSWGLSFYYGCRHLIYVTSTLLANAELLKVQGGKHPEVGSNLQIMAAASEGIRQAIEDNAAYTTRFALWQFRLLVAGAVFFVGWHVLEMYLRTSV